MYPLSALLQWAVCVSAGKGSYHLDRGLSRLIHSQISHAPESADLLYLENFIGNRITNLDGAKPSKWRAMIRTERRIWASDSASLHLCVASQMAMTSVQLTILPR